MMSNAYAVYLCNDHSPDAAIRRGLEAAGCRLVVRRTVGEALAALSEGCRPADALPPLAETALEDPPDAGETPCPPAVVVAEVDAGALVLLSLLNEWRGGAPDAGIHLGADRLPPAVLIFDRRENDIRIVAKALELGAWRYLLGSDPELERELAVHAVARRLAGCPPACPASPADTARSARSDPAGGPARRRDLELEWDARGRIVRSRSGHALLSAAEARVFGMLYGNRGRVTPMAALAREVFSPDELAAHQAGDGELDAHAVGQRLRPLMMRLRRKLLACPEVSGRLISVRGRGYMLR